MDEEEKTTSAGYDSDFDSDSDTFDESTPKRHPKDDVFQSLVEYNMNAGSPITQFFSSFDENSVDPFAAAKKHSNDFFNKTTQASFNYDQLELRKRTELLVNYQASRLQNSLDTYLHQMERATLYNINNTQTVNSTTSNRDLYSADGFISRPTHYDLSSLFNSQQNQDLTLRTSLYQVQENNVFSSLANRPGSVELVTQSYLKSPLPEINSDNLELIKRQNQTSMNVLLGNDIATKVLTDKGKSVATIGFNNFSLHAKVGYLYDKSDPNTSTVSFISTQNVTDALSRSHTTEEMLILRRHNFDDSARTTIRNNLIQELKDITDSIYDIASSVTYNTAKLGITEALELLKTADPKKFVEEIKSSFLAKSTAKSGANRTVFIKDEIQTELLKRLQQVAKDTNGGKVVISMQYVESLFIQKRPANASTTSYIDSGLKDYNNKIRRNLLKVFQQLAREDRLSIGVAGKSYGDTQGLFPLLDRYYNEELAKTKDQGDDLYKLAKKTMTTLIEHKSFSILPTRFAHSKSFAVIDDTDSQNPKLLQYGLGSSNLSYKAYSDNLEVFMMLDKNTIEGLTDKEQKEIADYYYYGVSNFSRLKRNANLSSPTQRRGSQTQTDELIKILKSMGGVYSTEGTPKDKNFSYTIIYDPDTYKRIGVDISIGSLNGGLPGYSFSVTLGQEEGIRGNIEPVAYLSKTGRVINGMTFVNNSSRALKVLGTKTLKPREQQSFNALEVVGGLVNTMQHMLTFEATRGSMNQALNIMTTADKTNAVQKILGTILSLEMNKHNLNSLSSREGNFSSLLQLLQSSNIDSKLKVKILQDSINRLKTYDRVTSMPGMLPSHLKPRESLITDLYKNIEIQNLFKSRKHAKDQADLIVSNLLTLIENTRTNKETTTMFSDLQRLMIRSDSRAQIFYNNRIQKIKTEMFNQITSPFMQPHELRYSMGQAMYKRPVYGINDDIYDLAEQQGTLDLLLSPHPLRHGETLEVDQKGFIRGKADHKRFLKSDLYDNLGGIYNVAEGAVSIRQTHLMMQTMRGLAIINKQEYTKRVQESLKSQGYTKDEILTITNTLTNELFSINKNVSADDDDNNVMYFPYRVTEQIPERMRNLQSTRPVESASYKFGLAADTLGASMDIDDVLSNPQTLIDNTFLTSLAPHQFSIIKNKLKSGTSASDILKNLKTDYANSQLLVRGFLGGSAPKRVLQSIGISTMSDFSYVNEAFRYETGNETTRPEYVQYHVTNISLDSANLLGNTSFKGTVEKYLKQGTSFIHKDQLIVNKELTSKLKAQTLDIAKRLMGGKTTDDLVTELGLDKSKISNSLRGLIDKFTSYGDDSSLNTFDDLANLDKRQLKVLNKLLGLMYESVNFREDTSTFYFKGGVYSPVTNSSSTDLLERLRSVKKIGNINVNAGYFTINAFSQYTKQGGQTRRQEPIIFKLPATSAREYRGISFLVENPYIYHSGASSIQLELTTATRRDMVSNLRPGSDTSKGPSYLIEKRIFEQLKKEQEQRKLEELLPERIRQQDIYAILSPSQIKGFNFEQGLMLLEDTKSSFLKFIDTNEGASAIAEGLALMMLGEKSTKGDTILELLATSLRKNDAKSQAGEALNLLAKANFAKKMKLPKRTLGDNPTKSDNLEPTFTVFGELASLALPEFVKEELKTGSPDLSKALIKTVAAALDSTSTHSTKALDHLKKQSLSLFNTARNSSNSFSFNGRFIFNDESTRTASILAFFTKASQDLFKNIDINQRLTGKSISEINPGYFLEGDNLKDYYTTNTESDTKKSAVSSLISSVRVIGSVLNIHLPSPEEIQKLDGEDQQKKIRELRLGLYQLNTILRLNRFLEFGIEQMPSRIAVAIGMQNMTKMEGQYMYELTKNQMGLYTDRHKESGDILSIQQAILMLGSIVEGELIDPTKARLKYRIQTNNLALIDKTPNNPLEFISKFTTSYTEQADKGLPTILNTHNKTTSLAEEAILNYVLGNIDKSDVALSELSNTKNLLLGLLGNRANESHEDNTQFRLNKIEDIILDTFLSDTTQRKRLITEVEEINKIRTASSSSSLSVEDAVKQRYQESKTLGNLIAREEYYESLFTRLTESGLDSSNIEDIVTKELLQDTGVLPYYRDQLQSKIESARDTSIGTEYVHQSLESLRRYSKTLKNIKSTSLNKDQQQRAASLYDSVTKTQLVTLPALYIGLNQKNVGTYDVFYASDSKQSGTHGILLGLDLLEKLSLVFQGQSHEALVTQIKLRYALQETAPLLKRITEHQLTKSADLNDLPSMTAEEKKQYENLQVLLLQSQATTMDLINNQETIRQSASDRLKLVGFSSIAMSSFLLNSHEIAAGSKFQEISQDSNTPTILSKDLSDASSDLYKNLKLAKKLTEESLRGGIYNLSDLNKTIANDHRVKNFVYSTAEYSNTNYVILDKAEDKDIVRLKRITIKDKQRTETILLEASKTSAGVFDNDTLLYYTGSDIKSKTDYDSERDDLKNRINTIITEKETIVRHRQTIADQLSNITNIDNEFKSLLSYKNLSSLSRQDTQELTKHYNNAPHLSNLSNLQSQRQEIIDNLSTVQNELNVKLTQRKKISVELTQLASNLQQARKSLREIEFASSGRPRAVNRNFSPSIIIPNFVSRREQIERAIHNDQRKIDEFNLNKTDFDSQVANLTQRVNEYQTQLQAIEHTISTEEKSIRNKELSYNKLFRTLSNIQKKRDEFNSLTEEQQNFRTQNFSQRAETERYIQGQELELQVAVRNFDSDTLLSIAKYKTAENILKLHQTYSLIREEESKLVTLKAQLKANNRKEKQDLEAQIKTEKNALLAEITSDNRNVFNTPNASEEIKKQARENRANRLSAFNREADQKRATLKEEQRLNTNNNNTRIIEQQSIIDNYNQQALVIQNDLKTIESLMEFKIKSLKDEVETSSIYKDLVAYNSIAADKIAELKALKSDLEELKSLYRKEVTYTDYKEYKQLSRQIREKREELKSLGEESTTEKDRIEGEIAKLREDRDKLKNISYTKYKKYSELTPEEQDIVNKLKDSIGRTRTMDSSTLFKTYIAKDILRRSVDEYNLIKKEYYLRTQKEESLPAGLEITYSQIEDEVSKYKGSSFVSIQQINDFVLQLVLATDEDSMKNVKMASSREEAQKNYELRKKSIKSSKTYSTMLRAGSPSGTSLLSETGTDLKETLTVEELRSRADILDTNISPAQQGSNTLVLMSALGTHYTQLGDNDGDSFQSAVTQMAVLTRRIKEQSQQIKELTENISLPHSPRVERDSTTKELAQEVRTQDIADKQKQLEDLKAQHNEALKQFELIRNNAVTKAKKGIRTFARVYSALPSELIGDEKFIKDIHLQSFVKQFRDTIGAADHVGSVMTATQSLTPEFLSSLSFKDSSLLKSTDSRDIRARLRSGFKDIKEDSEEFKNLQQYLPFINKEEKDLSTEEENLLAELAQEQRNLVRLGKTSEEELLAPIIDRIQINIATAAQLGAATSTITGKLLKSAQGSIINDQTLQELQAIIGTSTGGLLGTTYNTVVPLIALQMANIGAIKALTNKDDKSYRLALAAGIMAQTSASSSLSTHLSTSTEEGLNNLTKQLLTGEYSSKIKIARLNAEKSIEVAMRFVTTTQQFIRDAGLKPKERKGDTSSSGPKSLLEAVDTYTIDQKVASAYNIDKDKAENLQGLTAIIRAIEEANDPKNANKFREELLNQFLSTKVGEPLIASQTSKDDEALSTLRSFAALQIVTDYLSGKYKTTDDLIENSPLSSALKAARSSSEYTGLSPDDFITKYISNLYSDFQLKYTVSNVSIDLANRKEQFSTGFKLLEYYGLDKDGSALKDRDKKLEELRDNYLEEESLFKDFSAGDKDAKQFGDEYLENLRQRSDAVSTAIQSLTDDQRADQGIVYQTAMEALISKNLEQDSNFFVQGLQQLKSLHNTIQNMKDNNLPGVEQLEQELGLYSTAFANRLGSGHADLNLFTGFFANIIPKLASIDSDASSLTTAGDSSQADNLLYSLAGINDPNSLFSPNLITPDSVDESEYKQAYRKAGTHKTSLGERLELARHYAILNYSKDAGILDELTKLTFEAIDTKLSVEDQTLAFNKEYSKLETLLADKHKANKGLLEGKDLDDEITKYTELKQDLDNIKHLTKSSVEYAAETNAFSYAIQQLTNEMINIGEKLKTPDLKEEDAKVLQDRSRELENMLFRPQDNRETLMQEFKNLGVGGDSEAEEFVTKLEQTIAAHTKQVQKEQNQEARRVLGLTASRINNMSEGLSVLAIPALFAIMQNPGDSVEQIAAGTLDMYQSMVGSPTAMGISSSPLSSPSEAELIKSHRIMQSMQVSRIRNQLKYNDSFTSGLAAGMSFEGIFKASQVLTKSAVDYFEDLHDGFSSTVKGRFVAESIGGIIGLGLAGLITNTQSGLPTEDYTESNIALRVIDQIRQTSQAATVNFIDAVISSMTDIISDNNDSFYLSQVDFTEEGISTFERNEILGTFTVYDNDLSELEQQYDNA